MPATIASTARPGLVKSPGAVSRLFGSYGHGLVRYFVRRAAIASLRGFDDDALRDVGLVRSQIEGVVRGLITLPGREDVKAAAPARGTQPCN